MSPKAIPSVFTYQDEDSDVDVAIQFMEKDEYIRQNTIEGMGGESVQRD